MTKIYRVIKFFSLAKKLDKNYRKMTEIYKVITLE